MNPAEEAIAEWIACEHDSEEGTERENEWVCAGCGRRVEHIPDEYGEIYMRDGRYRAQILSGPDPELVAACAVAALREAISRDPSVLVALGMEQVGTYFGNVPLFTVAGALSGPSSDKDANE